MCKMRIEIITFDNTEVEKHKFHSYSNAWWCKYSIVVSNKVPFGKKDLEYFLEYEDDSEKIMILRILLPKMSAYEEDLIKLSIYVSFKKDDKLLGKCSGIWDKISKVTKKDLIVSLHTMKNWKLKKFKELKSFKNWRLKWYLMKKKSIQIFIMIICQKRILIASFYQWFWLTLFLKWVKTITLKCF